MSLTDIHPAITSLAIIVAAGIILRWLQPKARIIWSEPSGFTYLLDRPTEQGGNTFTVHTKTVFIQNTGKQSAEGVEVIFNWEPQFYNLWPVLPHEKEVMPDGRFVLRAKTLGPKEWFRVEILTELEMPATIRVRNADGDGKLVTIGPMRIYPNAVNVAVLGLLLIGAFSIIYHATAFVMPYLNSSTG